MIPEGAAIILGGGRSSRIGREKGLLKLDNRAVFEIVLTKLKCLFEEIILVTNTPSLFDGDRDFRIVTDEVPYQGPLGGILAGLSVSSKKYSFVVAYDMPFINTGLVEFLFTRLPGADVVIPSSEKGIEPLFAIYSKDCIPAIRKKLEGGQRRVISFFDEVKVERIDQDKVGRFDPQYLSFFNVNTPEDWEKAQRIYQSQKEKNDA